MFWSPPVEELNIEGDPPKLRPIAFPMHFCLFNLCTPSTVLALRNSYHHFRGFTQRTYRMMIPQEPIWLMMTKN